MPKVRTEDVSFGKVSRSRKKKSNRKIYFVAAALLVVGAIIGLPKLASNPNVLNWAIAKYAGIHPLTATIETASVSWTQPIEFGGVKVLDERRESFVEIEKIQTEISLLDAILGLNQLGTVTVTQPVLQIGVEPGTTSLEQSIAHLLDQPASEGSQQIAGRILVKDARVMLRDSVTKEQWQVTIAECSSQLPVDGQVIGKTLLNGQVDFSSRPSTRPPSHFEIVLSPLEGIGQASVASPSREADSSFPIEVDVIANSIPMECMNLIKRRFPEMPWEFASGSADAKMRIRSMDATHLNCEVETVRCADFLLQAQSFIGGEPLRLSSTQLHGKVDLDGASLTLSDLAMQSDFAEFGGSAEIPWPLPIPTATRPWVDDATLNLSGNIDIAKLTRAAPSLIVLQDGTRIQQGRLQVTASQSIGTDGLPNGEYFISLGDLLANVNGVALEWPQAFDGSVRVEPTRQGEPKFALTAQSVFANISGAGDFQGGDFEATVDLSALHTKLKDWIALPFSGLAGTARLTSKWTRDENQRVTATGNLNTSQIRIDLPTGQLQEPDWNGNYEIVALAQQNQIQQIDRLIANLEADSQQLTVEMLEPVSLLSTDGQIGSLPSAAASMRLVGDLAGWKRRAELFAGMDFGVELDGQCDLVVQAQVASNHVTVQNANWNIQPFRLETNGIAFRESRLIGEFVGNVNSQDLADLVVEKCTIQSETFALNASDRASEAGKRIGQASYVVQPNRLSAALQGVGSDGTGPYQLDGGVTGTLNWELNADSLNWDLVADTQQLKVFQTLASSPARLTSTNPVDNRQLLWEEPVAKLAVNGSYDLSDGTMELSQTQLQSEWIAYSGNAATEVTEDQNTQVEANGNWIYDAEKVMRRLEPMVGNYVQLSGTRTEPIQVVWTSAAGANWSDNLSIDTKLGWETASVLGIDVGEADVGIQVIDGLLTSETEIPVSNGWLRWNLQGNIAEEPMRFQQQPQRVIDQVAITPMMCQGWLKFVAPLLAEVTKVEGNLSLDIDRAIITPTDPNQQQIAGKLRIHQANVGPGPLADQILLLVNQVKAIRDGNLTAASSPQATWLALPDQQIEFAVDSGRVIHRDLRIEAGDVTITTSGNVGINGQLEMLASIPIRDEWLSKAPALASLQGQSLQVPIGGTLNRPQLDTRVFSQLAVQAAQGVAQGYLQKQVDRGLNKILGPMQEQLQKVNEIPPIQLPGFQGLIPQGLIPGLGGGRQEASGQPAVPSGG